MKKYVVTVNGNRYEVVVEEAKGDFANTPSPVAATTVAAPVAAPAAAPKAASAEGENVEAPMPGNIFKVNVSAGAAVKEGDVLFILEAMKMENEIKAPRDGKVAEVLVDTGAQVNTGDALLVLE